MVKNWRLANSHADIESLKNSLNLSELTIRLLANRGYIDEVKIREYLYPSFEDILDGKLMKDMIKGVDIIFDKIKESKSIRIVGDYDVDGVVSTFILMEVLTKCGAKVDYHIPDRIKEGYGLNKSIIEQAIKDGIDTILTCDNGISAIEEINLAISKGITVVITDHHQVGDVLPQANAIINPNQMDCSYPNKNICGAVVAAKFANILFEKIYGIKDIIKNYLMELAIATICDVMELTGENRAIVKLGLDEFKKLQQANGNTDSNNDSSNDDSDNNLDSLEALDTVSDEDVNSIRDMNKENSNNKIGLRLLLEYNNLQEKDINSYHIGYIIGPCINATGRLESAVRGVELLLSKDLFDAKKIVEKLIDLNNQRKEMTEKSLEEAHSKILNNSYEKSKVIVLYLDNCHESIAGIIAGRIRDFYYRPTIILTNSEQGLKGSARSIEGFHMFDELTKCADLLDKFGGHELAAGMSLNIDNLEEFRKRLNENCTLVENQLIPKLLIDGILPPSLLDFSMIDEINLLEPFGKGNRKVLLSMKEAKVVRIQVIGKNGNYLKFVLNDGNSNIDALYFSDASQFKEDLSTKYGENELLKAFHGLENNIKLTITYVPNINEYLGNKKINITIQDYMI